LRCCDWGCGGRRFEGSASVVVLIEYVGRLDPVSRHGDGFAVHKQFQHFVFPRQDLVGTAVRRMEGPTC
jgi:hypothetical protein